MCVKKKKKPFSTIHSTARAATSPLRRHDRERGVPGTESTRWAFETIAHAPRRTVDRPLAHARGGFFYVFFFPPRRFFLFFFLSPRGLAPTFRLLLLSSSPCIIGRMPVYYCVDHCRNCYRFVSFFLRHFYRICFG